jgi:hypothetical protein
MLEYPEKQENSFHVHILFFCIIRRFRIVAESLKKNLASHQLMYS